VLTGAEVDALEVAVAFMTAAANDGRLRVLPWRETRGPSVASKVEALDELRVAGGFCRNNDGRCGECMGMLLRRLRGET
jgi:hypothetical protein